MIVWLRSVQAVSSDLIFSSICLDHIYNTPVSLSPLQAPPPSSHTETRYSFLHLRYCREHYEQATKSRVFAVFVVSDTGTTGIDVHGA